MTLSRKEIEGLMKVVGLTQDDEIDCGQCLLLVAEFAEQELAGKSIPAGLEAVAQHLSVCTECYEEYEVLKLALTQMHHS